MEDRSVGRFGSANAANVYLTNNDCMMPRLYDCIDIVVNESKRRTKGKKKKGNGPFISQTTSRSILNAVAYSNQSFISQYIT